MPLVEAGLMKRYNVLLIITGVVSLAANLLAVVGYFTHQGPFAAWEVDSGLLTVLVLILLAYLMSIWSALVWKWTQGRDPRPTKGTRRAASFLLNALAAFPVLSLGGYMLLTAVLPPDSLPSERWVLALTIAWTVSPFAALGLNAVGEILGPLLICPSK